MAPASLKDTRGLMAFSLPSQAGLIYLHIARFQ